MLEERKGHGLIILVFFLLIINIYLFYLDLKSSKQVFTFAMLDVGQGDAIFLESPTGTQILFDGGPARKVLAPLSRVMSPLDKSIDALVITNPDADHIGGFVDILKNYEVGMVLEPGTFNSSQTYKNLKNEIKNKNIPNILARRGMRLHIGSGVVIDILFPDRDVSVWESNDGSIVARLTYGGNSIMLTGDATAKTEKVLLAGNSAEALRSTVLKVGHHGSRTSSSDTFVKAVSPEFALISSGKDNNYGHPHPDTLGTLLSAGVQILRTDLLGSIVMKCDRMAVCEIN